MRLSNDQLIEEINSKPTARVKVGVTDIDGVLLGKYMHRNKFASALKNGFGFCSVMFGWDTDDICYSNSKISGWHNGYPDVQATVDSNTFRRIPWENDIPFFIADFSGHDEVAQTCCPRSILKLVVKRAEKLGFTPMVGMEFEWFNFKENSHSLHEKNFDNLKALTPGMFGYSTIRQANNRAFFERLFEEMEAFNVPLEGLHTETGPGVLEAAIQYSDAVLAADRAVIFKTGVKEIGCELEIMPTFMARFSEDMPGNSGHLHQSLFQDGKNIFYDESRPHGMSKVFESYVAGQLALMADFLPFYAPNANSYRRLVEGYWAPTKVAWGVDNRTAALRVIPAGNATRVEVRVSGADVNPYLAMAASIASGLYGIEQGFKLDQRPVKGNAYEETKGELFSKNLGAATEKLASSDLAKEILGESFVEHFVNTRKHEVEHMLGKDIIGERRRYFEIV